MVCERCGNILSNGAKICEYCGSPVHTGSASGGAGAIRQGRARTGEARSINIAKDASAPLLPDAPISERRRRRYEGDAGRPTSRRGVPKAPAEAAPPRKRDKSQHVRRVMVNWALVWLVAGVLLIVSLIGGFVYLKTTASGQLILARLGQDADSAALWAYGTELLDQGYVEKSIQMYEQAYRQEPDREDIYDKLQLLAEAYEAAGRAKDAEEIFTRMYEELQPENPVAYRNVVRLMLSQERLVEAADFLKLAFEKTGENSFNKQRTEMLPQAPTAGLAAGLKYQFAQRVPLLSAQDYDIFYTLGDGLLPEEGILYTEPIVLEEGYHTIRAVCVSSDLVSDEMLVNYTVTLPAPKAPYASLARGTYSYSPKVWLRNMNEKPDENPVTIYYTLDGTSPTANSPIFDYTAEDPEPIRLPGGKSVTLKAVAVNEFGKVSNELEMVYEINISFKRYFNDSDEFSGFTIMTTGRDAFIKKYGEPQEETDIEDNAISGACIKLSYAWGEARFFLTEKGYLLYYVDSNDSSLTAPRKTKLGMSEKEITEKFRDMGQPNNQNGDRSLYYDESAGRGMIYKLEDGESRIEYSFFRKDGATVTLSYHMRDGKASRITVGCSY